MPNSAKPPTLVNERSARRPSRTPGKARVPSPNAGRATIAALCVAAITLFACNTAIDPLTKYDREHRGPAGYGLVGEACTQDADCLEELLCVTEAPGGFCTRICEYPADCPGESLCVKLDLQDDREIRACAPICRSDADCRGDFQCVSVGYRAVCSP